MTHDVRRIVERVGAEPLSERTKAKDKIIYAILSATALGTSALALSIMLLLLLN